MKRISGYISENLFSELTELAEKENRKIAPMISLLLDYAIREKNRKRKKVPSQHNPADMGKSNPK